MFDHGRSLTLRGTVTKFQWTNPHGYIELDVTDRVCEDNREAADEQGRRKIRLK